MKTKTRIFCFTIVLVFGISQIHAQDIDSIRINGHFEEQSLTDFINYLESEYKLKVFYKEEWVKGISISQQFNNTPLYQALNRTVRNTPLNFDFFQGNTIFISPKSLNDNNLNLNNAQLLTIIGDPLNIGRYRTAKIKGVIVDGKNGEPLTGAILYIPKLKKGTTSNSEGEFEIMLPTGEHRLQLTFMGYEQSDRRIMLIEDGNIELELFEESLSIEEVTVLGEDMYNSRTQMSLVRVDSKTIKELPVLMGETDVIKSLTMMAGVQTVSELAAGFNVRGGNTDQNLILVDGPPVFNPSHLFGFISMLNPDVIENITLYKGGLPAKYGERVSSVMEVGLKEGNNEHISVYGGLGLINSRLAIDGPLLKNKKLKVAAGGRTSYSNWIFKEIPNAEIAQSVTNFYDISGKTTYNFDLHNKLSLMAYSSNDEFSTSSETIMDYGNMLANLMSRNKLGEKLSGELNLSYSKYKSGLTYLGDDSFKAYILNNQLEYVSGKYDFSWHLNERHGINFGVNYIRYNINPGKITPKYDETVIETQKLDEENAAEIAAYISDEFQLTPNLFLNIGLRFNYFLNIGGKTVYLYDENFAKSPETIIDSLVFGKNEVTKKYYGAEPRLALNYTLQNGFSLKASYQRTRQNIMQISNNAVISPVETWKLSDYYLKPLISDQIAVGLNSNKTIPGFLLTSEVYFKKLKNLIEYKNGAEIIMNRFLETELIPSDGFSCGLELSAAKTTGRLTGMVNYMFSKTMQRSKGPFDEETLNNGSWYPSVYDRPHDLSITATYDISRRWRIAGNFVFISGRPVTLPEVKYEYAGQTLIYYSDRNKYRMPPYHRFDFSITLDENLKRKRSWKGSWTLSIYNFYGRKNPYSVYYRKSTPNASNNYKQYSLYKLSVIGIPVPTLTYNFRF